MVKRNLILFCFILFQISPIWACTSAIVGASRNPYGRPLLWKNRDTGNVDNKIEYVAGNDGLHSFVGLFNANDSLLSEVWMGMNDVGFAIMNTASYNLKDDDVPEKDMDKEGLVMKLALTSCSTVDDFEKLLFDLPKPMGVEANFGVIDAYGNGAYFETDNYSFVKYDLADSPSDILVRTNYSYSGRPEEGFGFVRENNALHLLSPYIEQCEVTPELFTEHISRSFWHDLYKKDFLQENDEWMIDQDFIPRYKSSATIVIEGCHPVQPGEIPSASFVENEYIMWTGLGYPPCSEILPVKCAPDGVDESLKGTGIKGHSSKSDIAKNRRDDVFPIHKGNGDKYIERNKLFNEEGTGYIQILVPDNLETYRIARNKRDNRPEM